MNQIDIIRVLQAPIISEKSTASADREKRFVFRVVKTATKGQVKKAVELMFGVEVDSVHVLTVKGKTKRSGRSFGVRPDWKKAYVKLKPGHDIELSVA
ncbi:50S ribosomal protein L23 [Methylolobus aquaticus]